MKRSHAVVGLAVAAALALPAAGCAKWKPQWETAGQPGAGARAEELLDQARALYGQADDRAKVLDLREAYRKVLQADPANYEALVRLSDLETLIGTGYTEKKGEKRARFREARRLSEMAMYTNPEFKARVDAGATPWEAAGTLGEREVEAMYLWVTAVQYEFKEAMSTLSQIGNVKWLQHALRFVERIEAIDPTFGGGAVQFAKCICLFVLPESMGGSDEGAVEAMNQSIENGEGWMLPKWARGKYFGVITGNEAAQESDLRWVVEQDISKYKDPYPWKVHFQDDARKILAELE